MKPIGIGLIGTGNRLLGMTSRMAEKAGGRVKFVTAYDPNKEAITRTRETLKTPGIKQAASVEEVVNDPAVSWVMIGSWNCFHREHAVAALNAGKDVFCEKPLATSLEDCLAIREAQERSGKRFLLGFTLRYSPLYRKVREIIEAGTIGRIVSLEYNETLGFNHGGYIHQDWRRKRENAGTHVLEKCCHDFDIVDSIVKSPVRKAASFGGCDFFTPQNQSHVDRIGPNKNGVTAFQGMGGATESPFRDDKDIVDNQVAILQYANGVRASFHTNCMSALPERRLYIQGTEGTLRADSVSRHKPAIDPMAPDESFLRIEVKRIGWDTETEVIDINTSGGHGGSDTILIDHMVDCVVNGQQPLTGVNEGLRAAINCFGVDQAMDEGRVVDLTPLWEKVGLPLDETANV